MKIKIIILFATVSCLMPAAFGQGALTPPGAPAPTMKSLDQIEPRVPISYPGYYISSPGSYYLTTNIIGSSGAIYGIVIASGDVTVDLNGFTLLNQGGASYGIYITGSHVNITVKNGIINGWITGVDVYSAGGSQHDLVFENLSVSSGNTGISVGNGCRVSNCTVSDCNGNGILVYGSGCLIEDNTLLNNNSGNSLSGASISIQGSNNRIEANHITGSGTSGYGIEVFGGNINNIVIKNSVVGGGANNYSVGSGNDFGPVGTASTSTSPWANISH